MDKFCYEYSVYVLNITNWIQNYILHYEFGKFYIMYVFYVFIVINWYKFNE